MFLTVELLEYSSTVHSTPSMSTGVLNEYEYTSVEFEEAWQNFYLVQATVDITVLSTIQKSTEQSLRLRLFQQESSPLKSEDDTGAIYITSQFIHP
jgi:hypothetical protein